MRDTVRLPLELLLPDTLEEALRLTVTDPLALPVLVAEALAQLVYQRLWKWGSPCH